MKHRSMLRFYRLGGGYTLVISPIYPAFSFLLVPGESDKYLMHRFRNYRRTFTRAAEHRKESVQ